MSNIKGKKRANKSKGLIALAISSTAMTVAIAAGALACCLSPMNSDTVTVTVPDLVGKRLEGTIIGNNFETEIEFSQSSDADMGRIIAQSPYGGARRKIPCKTGKCRITLTVGAGEQRGELPDVKGMPYSCAVAMLRELGLSVRTVPIYSGDSEDGSVTATFPSAYSKIKRGQSVTLYVRRSKACKSVEVRDYRGMSLSSACTDILARGLTLGNIEYENGSTFHGGEVISQSLVPDTYVKSGTRIDLWISSDKKENTKKKMKAKEFSPEYSASGWGGIDSLEK